MPQASECEPCARAAGAAEWLRTTDEVISTWTDIANLEAGTTYELRIVATNGGVTRASSLEEVTTDGIGWFDPMLTFFLLTLVIIIISIVPIIFINVVVVVVVVVIVVIVSAPSSQRCWITTAGFFWEGRY